MLYDNKYAWITRWKGEKTVEARAYLDSELLSRALKENQ